MPIISNVGGLKSAASADLFHTRFIDRYDRCIQNFEVDANARLRVLPMEAVASLTTVAGDVALPTDYLTWRTVKPTARPYMDELDYVHPAYLPPVGYGHVPALFTIENNTLKVRPVDDINAYAFHYYQKIPSLAAAADSATNWLLTEWPNAYLFGVLTELSALQRNAEMAQLYKARRDEVLQEIILRYSLTTGATSPTVRTAEYF
jgi:hypothetical protein